MVRNLQATTATGLRKNRVTQKTRLRVVRGQLDTDALLLDDEEDRNKVLASQGVDAEDANEHHLQAVLNGHRRNASDIPGKQSAAHIPIPDATGVVECYKTLYLAGKSKQPTTHLRFSDTVEETIEGGLAGGFAYFLDERDAEWIAKNNQEARGEGTSASATSSTNGVAEESPSGSTRSGRKGSRGKGKEPEHVNVHTHAQVTVDEEEFELVMGLFEKLTEEKFPFIHLSLDSFPAFADYEPVFANPLPPATFASYMVPASIPPPERLVLVAQTVYPHWKARKVEREGQRVVPQLDYDDSRESSYICFRRRDVKPVRRTRASSTAYTDKLARLRAELQMGLDLAKMVLERERLKSEATREAQEVWRMRYQLVEEWRAGDHKVSGMGIDESLMFDKERVLKKLKVEGLGRIVLGLNRRPMGSQSGFVTPTSEQHSPLTAHLDLSTIHTLSAQGYVSIQSSVRDRHNEIQSNAEREMVGLRARDNGWEDLLDLPYQQIPVPSFERLYRFSQPPNLASSSSAASPPSCGIDPAATFLEPKFAALVSRRPVVHETPLPRPAASPPSRSRAPERTPRSLRLRTGRGGRLHLDRRLHTSRTHPLLAAERARWPHTGPQVSLHRPGERDGRTRWESHDQRPDRENIPENVKVMLDKGKPGEEYWAHESVYSDKVVELGKRKREELDGKSIGFEHSGYGLGLVTSAEWEKGPGVEGREWKSESRDSRYLGNLELLGRQAEGERADEVDRAWRIDERWRYDADGGEEDNRFLLDDFQPKFLRTMISFLEAGDHDVVSVDDKYLTPPVIPHATPRPSRSSSRLGEQEKARLASLKGQLVPSLQLQPPPISPSHPPVLQTTPHSSTSPPLPLPQISSSRMDEQIKKMARQTPSVSPTTAAAPQASQRAPLTQLPTSTPVHTQLNGVPSKQTLFTNGIAIDSGATVRVSSPVRSKSHTPNPQHPPPQQGFGLNGFASHQLANHLALHPGHAHGLNPQQYATLRNVFADRAPGVQQQQQQGRPPMQMAGANVNLQMGPGNLNLKLPPTRQGQLRINGTAGAEAIVAGQTGPAHPIPPHPNTGSPILPHARGPPINGHLMTPSNDRASPVNAHLLGRLSPLARATLSTSPHHSHLVSLHSSPQPRPTASLAHQQVVSGAAQSHGYS